MPMGKIDAYRGVRDLVIAELTETVSEAGVVTASYGEVQWLAGVQTVATTLSQSSATHFFDNVGVIVITSEGDKTVTLTVSALDLKTRALIEGRTYDTTKEAFIESPFTPKYFALGFKGKRTDGTEEYIWFYKGQFSGGDITYSTEDDGTDIQTVEYTYTAVYTGKEYTYNTNVTSVVRGAVILSTNEAAGTFFEQVTTPDKIGVAA